MKPIKLQQRPVYRRVPKPAPAPKPAPPPAQLRAPKQRVINTEITVDKKGRKLYIETLACGHLYRTPARAWLGTRGETKSHYCKVCAYVIRQQQKRREARAKAASS